jgi:hypothetical protein
MWKWIVGGCLGLIVIVCFVMYFSWQKVKSFADQGPVVTTIIGAPSSHVFAAMSDIDSMRTWRLEGTIFRATQHGPLSVGDTLAGQSSNSQNQIVWVVRSVAVDTVIAFDGVRKTDGRRLFTRRDSVTAIGDSTRVTSIFAPLPVDSLRTSKGEKIPSGLSDFAMTAMTGAFRIQVQEELKRLKSHIEKAAAPPASKSPPAKP